MGTAAFAKGVKKAKAEVFGLKGALNDLKPILSGLATAMKAAMVAVAAAAATAFAGILLGISKVSTKAKEIETIGKRLNVGTEAYQAMSIAAQEVGMTSEQLGDKIKDMNEKLAEYAMTGGGGFKDFMETVGKAEGIKIEDLMAMPTEDRMFAIQAAMDAQNLSLEEQSFLWEGIASDMTWLIPMLQKGGAEYKKIRDFAQQTGQILSKETSSSLYAFSLNLDRIKGVLGGLGNIFISQFAPQLEAGTAKVLEMLGGAEGLRNAFASAGQFMGALIPIAAQTFGAMMSAITPLIENIGRIATYASTAAVAWGTYYVAGMAAAAVATLSVSRALRILRASLVSTGIGAIVVLAGEAVYQFLNWSDSVGGIGSAFTIAGEVGRAALGWLMEGGSALASVYDGVTGRIKGLFQSLWANVMSGFANLMGKIQGGVNSIIDGLNNAFTFEITNPLSGGVLAASSGLGLEQATFADKYKGMAVEADNAAQATKDAADAAIKSGMQWAKDGVGVVTDAYGKAAEKARAAKAAADEASKTTPRDRPVTPTLPGGSALSGLGGGAGGGSGGAASKAKEEVNKYADAVKALNKEIEILNGTQGKNALQQEIWKAQYDAGVLGNKTQSDTIAGLITQREKLEEQADVMRKNEEFWKSFSDSFSTGISQAISGASSFKDVLQDIGSMIIKWGLTKMMSTWFPGVKIGENATGTAGWGGGLTWVGERGPELVNLNRGARVYDNAKSVSMMKAQSGGQARMVVELSPDLTARVLEQSANQSVQIMQKGQSEFVRNGLPGEMKRISRDQRKSG